jgi:hypothetical protein
VGLRSDLALGRDGIPIVVYGDQRTSDVWVARCVDTTCADPPTRQRLEGVDQFGTWQQIIIGTDDLPFMAYRNDTSADVSAERCSNLACTRP